MNRDMRLKHFNDMAQSPTRFSLSNFDIYNAGINLGQQNADKVLSQENERLKVRILELQYNTPTEVNVDTRIEELKHMNKVLIDTLATLNKKL